VNEQEVVPLVAKEIKLKLGTHCHVESRSDGNDVDGQEVLCHLFPHFTVTLW
jgi:hypothetical protein